MERRLSRRVLLGDLGKVTVAAVVLGFAGSCSTEPTDGAEPAPTGTGADGTGMPTGTATTPNGTEPAAGAAAWHRVDLGFVSAYVLVRDGEAIVVDTGVEGSADDIEAALSGADLSWSHVGHVVLTHKHPDHVGSLDDVLDLAADARAFAGADDLPNITTAHEVAAVGDGDAVGWLTVVATPGHTPGHISVHDPAAGLLVAGDALNGADGGGVAGPNPDFTEDMDAANASVRRLAELPFDTVVFGHGNPVEGGADQQVAELAESR